MERHKYTTLPPNTTDMELIEIMDDRVLTSLQVSIERFDMHDVADSSSDNHPLSTIRFSNTDYSSKTPIREVCITFSKKNN